MQQQTHASEKKPYETPKLAELGAVATITQVQTGPGGSGGVGNFNN